MNSIKEMKKGIKMFRDGMNIMVETLPVILDHQIVAQFSIGESLQRLEAMEVRMQERMAVLTAWEATLSSHIRSLMLRVDSLFEHFERNGREQQHKLKEDSSDTGSSTENVNIPTFPILEVKKEDMKMTQSCSCSLPLSTIQPVVAMLNSALLHAAQEGNIDDITRLILEGADVNTIIEGITPLSIAARNGHYRCVTALLDAGADINFADATGYTALHHASSRGKIEVLKVLLARGIDVNVKSKDGTSACTLAYDSGFKRCCSLLMEYGANLADI